MPDKYETMIEEGGTGAGKTTITNLINRFYEIQHGTITYDGINVKDIRKASLRASLGMVLQETKLFSGTVLDNIRYGRLDATDEDTGQRLSWLTPIRSSDICRKATTPI
jgi:ABC-type multidrug transport system fused ATPase/permease subunit